MTPQKIDCAKARQIDLVDYLQSLHIHPAKIKGNAYWYHSPLRHERTPSFKVDRKLNLWYDHGMGKGGNLVDFGVLFFNCSVTDFLGRVNQSVVPFPFHQPDVSGTDNNNATSKIRLIEVKHITDRWLQAYLEKRAITSEIANTYCKEIHFEVNQKRHTCIGFKNNAGGYELRNAYYKGTIAPKDYTFIENGHRTIAVFEGFMDFLSFIAEREKLLATPTNYLILNSLAFFEKARMLMENHSNIFLFLDNDEAGKNITAKATASTGKYIDKSGVYSQCKDVNDWLVNQRLWRMRQPFIRVRF
ncbi:toprim domain-containing protein [Chitinophagaceae bacterium 26-R-25]|nr:toprim domain-containing protein [Chitinophagaceae bacterium 26-R-25]